MTRLASLVLLSTLNTACASLYWGIYPEASGPGVEPAGFCRTEIRTPEVEAVVELKTYKASFVSVGPLLPVIPIYPIPFFFMSFGPPAQLEVTVELKGGTGSIRPESLYLTVDKQVRAPASIRASHSFWKSGGVEPMPASDRAIIIYDFKYLDSPPDRFSLWMDGLPAIEYEPEADWRFSFWFGN